MCATGANRSTWRSSGHSPHRDDRQRQNSDSAAREGAGASRQPVYIASAPPCPTPTQVSVLSLRAVPLPGEGGRGEEAQFEQNSHFRGGDRMRHPVAPDSPSDREKWPVEREMNMHTTAQSTVHSPLALSQVLDVEELNIFFFFFLALLSVVHKRATGQERHCLVLSSCFGCKAERIQLPQLKYIMHLHYSAALPRH